MLEIPELLNKLEAELRQTIAERQLVDPLIIGIRTGGVWIAEIMHQRLAINEPPGLLDISFYRMISHKSAYIRMLNPVKSPVQKDAILF